ncbi:Porin [Rhodobacteraceae bacterium THAF1]|uniref:porin n=1 Tax=Palleronia sp. THAF1 TaxID=2587842 RepID=UPI000F401C2F|nr:porin [Palleronia sp. THAF1]QFU09926.1 Porin [Palleronia sp. THAF1]VDC17171.1 Porin [Rhodobacteraceae bacterium THAF1]
MKNLLLASTALVASTAFAMADVDISGSAEMGVFGVNADDDIDDGDLQFHTDINVVFTMAGETDAGLTFGAEVELSDVDGPGVGATDDDSDDGGAVIFVSGVYGTLTMGDTDGALDFALQEAIIGSSIADDHEHVGYNGNAGLDGIYDGQVARYDYTFGDFSFAVSAEIQDEGIRGAALGVDGEVDGTVFGLDVDGVDVDGDPALGVGMRYSGSFAGFDFGAGIGYQQADLRFSDGVDSADFDVDIFGISLDTTVAGFQVILNYSELNGEANDGTNDVDFDADHFGIAVGYTFGEILVAANYGIYDFDDGGEDEGFGLVANYDLGGGAALEFGYGYNDPDGDDNDFDTYSFGISMDF